jgi:hypothetical protein
MAQSRPSKPGQLGRRQNPCSRMVGLSPGLAWPGCSLVAFSWVKRKTGLGNDAEAGSAVFFDGEAHQLAKLLQRRGDVQEKSCFRAEKGQAPHLALRVAWLSANRARLGTGRLTTVSERGRSFREGYTAAALPSRWTARPVL